MQRSGGFDHSWASSTDEAYQEQRRLIVSADEFLGPANRRQVFDVLTGTRPGATPTPRPRTRNSNFSLRLADSPEPTPKTISRRANLKFRPLAKLISGKPALVALSFFGFSCALLPIENSEEPDLITRSVVRIALVALFCWPAERAMLATDNRTQTPQARRPGATTTHQNFRQIFVEIFKPGTTSFMAT